MKKKIFTLMLVGTLSICLSGCSLVGRALQQQIQNQITSEITSQAANPNTSPEVNPDYTTTWSAPNGENTTTDPVTSTDPGNTSNPAPEMNTLTSSYLPDNVESAVRLLQTDYNKIAWGVRYNPGDAEGIVISVTPFTDPYGSWYLLVGVTNMYDKPVTVSASGYAKGSSGTGIGNVFVYGDSIGSGSTVLSRVYCSEQPSGEIHWDTFETKDASREYVYWEGDYKGSVNSGACVVDYEIQTQENASIEQVYVVIVDEKGFVLDYGSDIPDEKNTTNFDGEVKMFGSSVYATNPDVAVFANPVK